jgi:predicted lipoprotein with Yx(FWY)xxD motif
MQHANSHFIQGLGLGAIALVSMFACANGDDPGGIAPNGGKGGKGGAGGKAGSSAQGKSGSANFGGASAGSAGEIGESGGGGAPAGEGGSTSGEGGSGTAGKGGTGMIGGADGGGQAGEDAGNAGDPSFGGNAAGGSGSGGLGGSGGNGPSSNCIYHSPPVVGTGQGGGGSGGGSGGGGSGGDGGSAPRSGVKVASHTFLGPYLTDSAGYALYIYGADVPGDCNNLPVTNCYNDCAIAWPIFNANARELDPALDDTAFGTIERTDGTFQTTYYGWPLYYYKSDTAPNVINGQNKAKIWFAAETHLPNLMIMRTPVAAGGIKYLSDDRGYTLYAHAADTVGTPGTAPVSACTGACLDAYAPYAPDEVFPVTYLEPHDVRFFFRADGTYQASFKGAPLYYSRADLRAGQQNGLQPDVWGLVTQ